MQERKFDLISELKKALISRAKVRMADILVARSEVAILRYKGQFKIRCYIESCRSIAERKITDYRRMSAPLCKKHALELYRFALVAGEIPELGSTIIPA